MCRARNDGADDSKYATNDDKPFLSETVAERALYSRKYQFRKKETVTKGDR